MAKHRILQDQNREGIKERMLLKGSGGDGMVMVLVLVVVVVLVVLVVLVLVVVMMAERKGPLLLFCFGFK